MDRLLRPLTDPTREMRGRIYQAQLRIERLESAWPPETRNPEQNLAVAQAHEALEFLQRRAAAEGIEPWSREK